MVLMQRAGQFDALRLPIGTHLWTISEPSLELRILFERLLFSWWVGNGDLHLKNLSLYVDDQGTIRLTPAYDLVATRLVIANDELALPIIGREQKLKRSAWRTFA